MRLLLTLALVVPSALASAQDEEAPNVSAQAEGEVEARGLFVAGREAFTQGRFEDALQYFTRAHSLSLRPQLTFNIASSYDRLGQVDEAIAWFERYLAEAVDAPNRAFVVSRVDVLRRLRESGDESNDSSDDPVAESPPEEPPPSRGGAKVASIIMFGLAGAAGIAGIAVGAVTLSDQSDIDSRCPDRMCDESVRGDVDALETKALATDILLASSLAFAAGATAALIVSLTADDDDEERASVSPWVAPTGAGLAITARY